MPIARETRRESIVLDGFAECMGHEHRRKILFLLYQSGEGERLRVPEDLLNQDLDRERFVLELSHSHLPKLTEAGLISWDRERGEISEGDKFEEMEPLLEVLSMYYDHIVPTFDPNQKA